MAGQTNNNNNNNMWWVNYSVVHTILTRSRRHYILLDSGLYTIMAKSINKYISILEGLVQSL